MACKHNYLSLNRSLSEGLITANSVGVFSKAAVTLRPMELRDFQASLTKQQQQQSNVASSSSESTPHEESLVSQWLLSAHYWRPLYSSHNAVLMQFPLKCICETISAAF